MQSLTSHRRQPNGACCSCRAWSSVQRRWRRLSNQTNVAYKAASVLERLPVVTADLADIDWDAIVVGSGVGGLSAASQLAVRGCKVLVLEKYIIPGGSAGQFEKGDFKFDVGSSMMFGLARNVEGSTNLITKALEAVGRRVDTIPDPSQLQYHLPRSERHPGGLTLTVWTDYTRFLEEIVAQFPHEARGIRGFFGECWRVFNALNSLELRSLDEPRFLMGQFFQKPLACLTLAYYATTNTGDVARKHITDPELLRFLDIECFCWSTVLADATPFINAGMVLCDRFFGGINYPRGGVGEISRQLVAGLEAHGGRIAYKANVSEIMTEAEDSAGGVRAVGVRMADGVELRARCVISNATRWDTFGKMLRKVPENEAKFRQRYTKAPSFLSLHLGVRAEAVPLGTECHHIVVEDWDKMEDSRGCLFVSIPSLLDDSLAPPGTRCGPTGLRTSCKRSLWLSARWMQAPCGSLSRQKHARTMSWKVSGQIGRYQVPDLALHCLGVRMSCDHVGADAGTHTFHAFAPDWIEGYKGLGGAEYQAAKEAAADEIIDRLEAACFPGLRNAIVLREVGSPRTHMKFLNREDGTYGPIPMRPPLGILNMPFSRTDVKRLYCAGDSTFPGQGVNAVVFSGFGAAHRALVELGKEPTWPIADKLFNAALDALRYNT